MWFIIVPIVIVVFIVLIVFAVSDKYFKGNNYDPNMFNNLNNQPTKRPQEGYDAMINRIYIQEIKDNTKK